MATNHGNRDHGGAIGASRDRVRGVAAASASVFDEGRAHLRVDVQNVNAAGALWRARCPTANLAREFHHGRLERRAELDARLSVHQREADTAWAMLSCGSGAILKCTARAAVGEGFRYGACKDQQGAESNDFDTKKKVFE